MFSKQEKIYKKNKYILLFGFDEILLCIHIFKARKKEKQDKKH